MLAKMCSNEHVFYRSVSRETAKRAFSCVVRLYCYLCLASVNEPLEPMYHPIAHFRQRLSLTSGWETYSA